ncbi:MAG: tetratricopeptide repeat protein, partial [Bdellovibrionota bacterium]
PKWKDDQTFFSWMLERNPKSFNAINRLADIEREAGRLQNALDLYQASLQVAAWQPYPWLYSAFTQHQLGRKDEAIATLKSLLAKYPGYEPAETNLKMLLESN